MATTHGLSRRPEYRIWSAMITRCENPRSKSYARYGGRGIKVCESWRRSFKAFFGDMGPRPSPAHSIERKNNAVDYDPTNCRWATSREQARNTRANRLLTHGGATMCLAAWAEKTGLDEATIDGRLRRGWSVAKALATPLCKGDNRAWHATHGRPFRAKDLSKERLSREPIRVARREHQCILCGGGISVGARYHDANGTSIRAHVTCVEAA